MYTCVSMHVEARGGGQESSALCPSCVLAMISHWDWSSPTARLTRHWCPGFAPNPASRGRITEMWNRVWLLRWLWIPNSGSCACPSLSLLSLLSGSLYSRSLLPFLSLLSLISISFLNAVITWHRQALTKDFLRFIFYFMWVFLFLCSSVYRVHAQCQWRPEWLLNPRDVKLQATGTCHVGAKPQSGVLWTRVNPWAISSAYVRFVLMFWFSFSLL